MAVKGTLIRRLAGYRARIGPLAAVAATAVLAAAAMSAPLPAASAAGPGTPPGLAGQNWTAVPTHAKVVAAGQRIGDHSVSHPYFTKLTDAQMRDEVLGAESQITSVTGVDPWPWFRFPYGDYDAHAISVVNGTGFVPVGWTVDTLGWKGPQAASPSRRWSTG